MRRKKLSIRCLYKALICVILICLFLPGYAFSKEPFYKGKTINLMQGREPGGLADMRVRAIIPFFQKYIPGNPNIASSYMPGGGGRKAANHIFNKARPDGLTIANIGALVASAILGETGVLYDIDKLIYLGTPISSAHNIFLTNSKLGLSSLEKLRAYPELKIGAQAVGQEAYLMARLFAWFLEFKNPSFVTGYSGSEIDIALMGGELDGRATIANYVLQRYPEWKEKGLMDFHVIFEIPKGAKHPVFTKVPYLETFARSTKEIKLLTILQSVRLAGSPYILPPGTPQERVEILREAMRKTFKDPAFRIQFKKLTGDEPSPLTGEQLEKYIREIPRDREFIVLLNKISGTEALPPR